METIKQEVDAIEIKGSVVEKQKEEAAKFVAHKIEAFRHEKNVSLLDATRRIYEEVKGHSYREEQAVIKLLEYLNMQNELDLRKSEIKNTFPGLFTFTNASSAANDDKYSVAA